MIMCKIGGTYRQPFCSYDDEAKIIKKHYQKTLVDNFLVITF